MDPASAIGVASAAITFLDFSIDVCKTFSQIITSEEGLTKYNTDVAETVKRYKAMSEALKAKGASATGLELGPNISRAVDESIAVSMELFTLVERLRQARDAPVIGPLKAVYRSMRSIEQIERLQREAERCQSDIIQGLIQATWETSTLNHESSNKAFQHLDKQDTEILAALKAGNSDLLKQLFESRRHFDNSMSNLQESVRTGNNNITQKIDDLTQKVLDMAKPDLKKAFVDSLFFPDYERREKALSGPSPKTFKWIFNRDGVAHLKSWREVKWPSFPQWLEDADSSKQYWLSGKAGSGKSTLMAHIIRDDMALKRTEGHLKKWHGTKTLHILKFFLFRPGRKRQAGLEFLLRSLLYQLVTFIPILQEILMARFARPDCGARIPTWPVGTLKNMLGSALDAANDCCFLIFIDGADELEDSEYVRGQSMHATDLVDFLFDIQRPQHVKLCISSRPELRITNAHQSFLKAKLANLNHNDIHHFANQQMQAMDAIPKSKDRTGLAREIASRADGIFLWAAFAITQMKEACRDGDGEDYSGLLKKLDDMGEDLNGAISQMLRGIEKSHRPALAFYLQALKSWRDTGLYQGLTVGLIVASRSSEEIQTRSQFLAACRREERDIQNFSQGIIEVKGLGITPRKDQLALVRSHSGSSSDSDLQHESLDFEPGEGAWVAVTHADHYFEITKSCDADVSFIHRSAYDFFFAPDAWNSEHVEQCRSLFDLIEESRVHAKVQAGLKKLLWIAPCPLRSEKDNKTIDLYHSIGLCCDKMIFVMCTAKPPLNQNHLTTYLDDLLSSMRLELLLDLVKAPIIESREHIPGDIFSNQLHNGCLRELDEDRLLTFESTGLQEDLQIIAEFESRILDTCARWETLYDFVEIRLSVSNGRVIAPLVQASLLNRIAISQPSDRGRLSSRGQMLLLKFVKRWVYALARRRRSKQFYNSVWQWIVLLVPGYDDGPRHEDPKGTRRSNFIKSAPFLGGVRPSSYFQWTPLALDGITGRHEEILIKSLVRYGTYFAGVPRDHLAVGFFDSLVQIVDCWDVWIEYSQPKDASTIASPCLFA